MYRRSPLGNPLLWIVACLVLPEVVKRCKPLAKVVGDTLVTAGETFRKAAAEPPAPPVAEVVAVTPEPESEPETAQAETAPKAKKSKPAPPEQPDAEPEA